MPVEAREVGGDGVEHPAERLVGDGAFEAEALGEARRADVQAEALVDLLPAPERELRAAAAGVEHDERAAAENQARLDSEIGEPRLLLTADHLDLDACTLAHGIDENGAVRSDPQPCGTDRGDRLDPVAPGLLRHRRDRGRPSARLQLPRASRCRRGLRRAG